MYPTHPALRLRLVAAATTLLGALTAMIGDAITGPEGASMVRSTRPVCLIVTPCFSADCANVEHPSHESFARAAVIAYWRHMPTADRHRMIREQVKAPVKAVPEVCFGATRFVTPLPHAAASEDQRYLGTRDLYMQFEGQGVGWALGSLGRARARRGSRSVKVRVVRRRTSRQK